MRLAKQLAMESSQRVSTESDEGLTTDVLPEEQPALDLDATSRDCEELATLIDQAGLYQGLVQEYPPGTVLTASEEKLLDAVVNMSLAGTGVSIEKLGEGFTLEGMAANVLEAIKKAINAIIEKIKQFIAWVTGNKDKSNKQHEKVAEHLKSEAGKEAMKDLQDPEKQKAAEHVSTESHVSPAMLRISARQLSRYTVHAGRGGLIFVDDVVWEVCEQLEFFQHMVKAQQDFEAKLGNDIATADLPSDKKVEKLKAYMVEFMHALKAQSATSILGSQGTAGSLAFKVCGVMHLEYNPETMQTRFVSHDVEHDYNRHFVIAIRDANKLTMNYDQFVKRCRQMDGAAVNSGTIKQLERQITEVNQMGEQANRSLPPEEGHAVVKMCHVLGMLVMAQSFILRASMTLDHDLMKWVPKS